MPTIEAVEQPRTYSFDLLNRLYQRINTPLPRIVPHGWIEVCIPEDGNGDTHEEFRGAILKCVQVHETQGMCKAGGRWWIMTNCRAVSHPHDLKIAILRGISELMNAMDRVPE